MAMVLWLSLFSDDLRYVEKPQRVLFQLLSYCRRQERSACRPKFQIGPAFPAVSAVNGCPT